MPDQIQLPLREPAPAVTPEQVELLVAALRACDGQATAAVLGVMMSVKDRKVREIASAAAPAVVSFPGSPGYKLWAHCSVDEINHAIEAFESQGKDMLKRANLYRQAYHKRFRASS